MKAKIVMSILDRLLHKQHYLDYVDYISWDEYLLQHRIKFATPVLILFDARILIDH